MRCYERLDGMEYKQDPKVFLENKFKLLLATYPTLKNLRYYRSNTYDSNDYDGYVSTEEKLLFYVMFTENRSKTKDFLLEKANDVPVIVFSEKRFALVRNSAFSEHNIKSFEGILKGFYIEGNEEIISDIEKSANNVFNSYYQTYNTLFNEHLVYFDKKTFTFKISELFINDFFNYILESVDTKVYRYTSQASIFNTVKSDRQRLFSLAGMNDPDELNYTDTYVYGSDYTPTCSFTNNDIFILSCCTAEAKDDLTMYRLYADDARGVCVEYEINEKRTSKADIYIKKVEYADKDGINYKLETIKELVDKIERTTGFTVDIFGDSPWKYFFKPHQYAYEKEVRLLIIDKNKQYQKDWVITNGNNILNPFIDLDLNIRNGTPIRLRRIILGPKHPEKEINHTQYQEFVRQFRPFIGTVSIDLSRIKNYR